MSVQDSGKCPLCRALLTTAQVFGFTDLAPRKPTAPAPVDRAGGDDDDSRDERSSDAVPMQTESLFAGVQDLQSSTKFDAVVKQLQEYRRCPHQPLSHLLCQHHPRLGVRPVLLQLNTLQKEMYTCHCGAISSAQPSISEQHSLSGVPSFLSGLVLRPAVTPSYYLPASHEGMGLGILDLQHQN